MSHGTCRKITQISDFGAKKRFLFFKKLKKNFTKNHKTEVLDILETRLVSKFGVIRLKITLFSKEKRYF